jgi:hypothetical protein
MKEKKNDKLNEFYTCILCYKPVSMAEQSKACTVYNRSNIGITGSNPAQGIDMCWRFSVSCCPVSVEALHWTDSPTKESYQMSIGSRSPLRKAYICMFITYPYKSCQSMNYITEALLAFITELQNFMNHDIAHGH